MSTARKSKPVPLTDALSRQYWDAARDGTLLIQRCLTCGTHQFYPRSHCTTCYSPGPEWVAASGRGTLHTFSVIYRSTNPEFADDCPYVFAIVELEERVRMATRIVDTAHERLRCDAPVRVTWTNDDPPLPVFVIEPEGKT